MPSVTLKPASGFPPTHDGALICLGIGTRVVRGVGQETKVNHDTDWNRSRKIAMQVRVPMLALWPQALPDSQASCARFPDQNPRHLANIAYEQSGQ
jgi:hypothetical protein